MTDYSLIYLIFNIIRQKISLRQQEANNHDHNNARLDGKWYKTVTRVTLEKERSHRSMAQRSPGQTEKRDKERNVFQSLRTVWGTF